MLKKVQKLILNFENMGLVFKSHKRPFLSIIEDSFHEDPFAKTMDRLQIAVVETVPHKCLFYLHDNEPLVLPFKLFPKDKITKNL